MSLLAFLCFAVAFFRSVSQAAPASSSASREAPPLFPVTEVTLTNGLRLITLEDHRSPLVSVQVWYQVGSADEPADRRGFAHLFEHLMFRGTDRLGPTEHLDLIQSVGGDCNAFTSFDETCYHETLPAQQVELALWLESERMAFLTIDSAGFATERKVVEEERRMYLNQPYGDLVDQALPAIFGRHPYANAPIGTIRYLRQAEPKDVHAWWIRWYTPNNATLVVAGDIKADGVRQLAERYFGWMPPAPLPGRKVPPLETNAAGRAIVLKSKNAPAPAVGMIWRTVPEGAQEGLDLELLASILGGDQSSRFYRVLVAEKHLAVAAMALPFGLKQGGVFGIGAILPPVTGDASQTLAAIRDEMALLMKDGVTQQELEKARRQGEAQLVFAAQTVEGKARLIGRAAVVGRGVEELNRRRRRLQEISREDLNRMARSYLDPDRALTASIEGPGLLGQLARLLGGNRSGEESSPIAAATSAGPFRGRPGIVRGAELPSRPPVKEGQERLASPEVQEQRLSNGLRVLVLPDTNRPVLHLVLGLPFGAGAEPKPGAASLAVAMLNKGTKSWDEKALAEELARHAIQLTGSADYDDVRMEASCLDSEAQKAFSLLAEVVLHPTFPEAPFKTAVAQALTELAIVDKNPGSVADREFRRHLFPRHPYGRRLPGESSELSALTREDLELFWRQSAHPEKAVLVIAGGIAPDHAFSLSERFFGGWKGVEAPLLEEPGRPSKPGKTHILLVDWTGAAQSEIRAGTLGIVQTDPDRAIAQLVSGYFGGPYASRLNKTIRIEKGATYGAEARFQANRFSGMFQVSTFTKTDSTAQTVKLVLGEIKGLVDRPPSTDELRMMRRYLLGNAPARLETPRQIAGHFARIALNGLPLDMLERDFAMIGRAEAGQCARLARRVVNPEEVLIVVVGDAARVREELAEIAPVTLLERDGGKK